MSRTRLLPLLFTLASTTAALAQTSAPEGYLVYTSIQSGVEHQISVPKNRTATRVATHANKKKAVSTILLRSVRAEVDGFDEFERPSQFEILLEAENGRKVFRLDTLTPEDLNTLNPILLDRRSKAQLAKNPLGLRIYAQSVEASVGNLVTVGFSTQVGGLTNKLVAPFPALPLPVVLTGPSSHYTRGPLLKTDAATQTQELWTELRHWPHTQKQTLSTKLTTIANLPQPADQQSNYTPGTAAYALEKVIQHLIATGYQPATPLPPPPDVLGEFVSRPLNANGYAAYTLVEKGTKAAYLNAGVLPASAHSVKQNQTGILVRSLSTNEEVFIQTLSLQGAKLYGLRRANNLNPLKFDDITNFLEDLSVVRTAPQSEMTPTSVSDAYNLAKFIYRRTSVNDRFDLSHYREYGETKDVLLAPNLPKVNTFVKATSWFGGVSFGEIPHPTIKHLSNDGFAVTNRTGSITLHTAATAAIRSNRDVIWANTRYAPNTILHAVAATLEVLTAKYGYRDAADFD